MGIVTNVRKFLIIWVAASLLLTALFAGTIAYADTTTKNQIVTGFDQVWPSTFMLLGIDNTDGKQKLPMHEEFGGFGKTFSRYTLDQPVDLKIWDSAPWWDVFSFTKIDDALSQFTMTSILKMLGNGLANFFFSAVRTNADIAIMTLQIALSGSIFDFLFGIFAAISKIIGIVLIAKDFFFVSMILLGGYMIWQAIIKRKFSTAIGEMVLSIGLLAFALIFIASPAKVMSGLNDTSDAIGIWIMQIGVDNNKDLLQTSLSTSADLKNTDNLKKQASVSTDKLQEEMKTLSAGSDIRTIKNAAIVDMSNRLWAILVRAPWAILQFGMIDIDMGSPTDKTKNKVLITNNEVAAFEKVLTNNKIKVGTGSDVQTLNLNTLGMKDGEPWADVLLKAEDFDKGDTLRSILSSILATSKEKPLAHSSLNDYGIKVLTTLILTVTSSAMMWFIVFVAAGLIMAQVVVLVSMLVGPFVLILSAFPKFGHRYVKNWGLITLGAFGTKILYYILLAVTMLLISLIITICYDMESLGLTAAQKQELGWVNNSQNLFAGIPGGAPLIIVHGLILLILIGINKLRQRMFENSAKGAFNMTGALINNWSRGKFKDSAKIYNDAMNDRAYGHLLDRKSPTLDQKMSSVDNPLNLIGKKPPKDDNPNNPTDQQGTQGAQGSSPNKIDPTGKFKNISNHKQLQDLGEDKYIRCPISENPCTDPSAAWNPTQRCPDGHATCPFHDSTDTSKYQQQNLYIRDGASEFSGIKPQSQDQSNKQHPNNQNSSVVQQADGDMEFLADSPTSTESGLTRDRNGASNGSSDTLPCPFGGPCTNDSVAYGEGSGHCSAKGNKLCPYRDQFDAEHYNDMIKRKNARDHVTIDAPPGPDITVRPSALAQAEVDMTSASTNTNRRSDMSEQQNTYGANGANQGPSHATQQPNAQPTNRQANQQLDVQPTDRQANQHPDVQPTNRQTNQQPDVQPTNRPTNMQSDVQPTNRPTNMQASEQQEMSTPRQNTRDTNDAPNTRSQSHVNDKIEHTNTRSTSSNINVNNNDQVDQNVNVNNTTTVNRQVNTTDNAQVQNTSGKNRTIRFNPTKNAPSSTNELTPPPPANNPHLERRKEERKTDAEENNNE